MKKIVIIICLMISGILSAQLQWQKGGNNGLPFNQPPTIGSSFNWNSPIQLITNGAPRMHINGNGTVAAGVFTDGFIGIGTNNPISPLHIVGNQQANAQGWRRGLTLSYNAAIQWDGDGERGFFMAHPSGTPNGNWYAGINSNQLPALQ